MNPLCSDREYYEKQLQNMENQLSETLKLVAAQQRVSVRDVFPSTEKTERRDHKKGICYFYDSLLLTIDSRFVFFF